MTVPIDVRDLLGHPGASRTVQVREPVAGLATQVASVACSFSGTGWRKSLDAFSHVTLRMSASETPSRPSAARSWVSGHVESACG